MSVTLEQLSAEDKAKLLTALKAEELDKENKIKEERKAYKEMVEDTVPRLFHVLTGVSAAISSAKTLVFNELAALIDIKSQVYGREDNQTHSFTTKEGLTLIIGHRFNDGWDDTVTAGVAKVNAYLDSIVDDDKTRVLVSAIRKLLSKDAKGNLQSSRVIQLRKIAEDSGATELVDAIKIIQDAHRPVKSCEFVTCRYKGSDGKILELPLDMSKADFDFVMPEGMPITVDVIKAYTPNKEAREAVLANYPKMDGDVAVHVLYPVGALSGTWKPAGAELPRGCVTHDAAQTFETFEACEAYCQYVNKAHFSRDEVLIVLKENYDNVQAHNQ